MSLIEEAVFGKFRWDTPKGRISIEDLCDVLLIDSPGKMSLDTIAGDLHQQIQNSPQISFVSDEAPVNVKLKKKLDIVKELIVRKKAEQVGKVLAQVAHSEAANKLQIYEEIGAEAEKERIRKLTPHQLKAEKTAILASMQF